MGNRTVGQDSLVGRTLGHYRIVASLGHGGQGVVYRACDLHLDNREVAIKVMPEGVDAVSRQRFRKEAKTLSKLNHSNIASVIDFDCCEGIDFLAEEFVKGVSLDEVLVRGPLSEKRLVKLGGQMCEGLQAAHQLGIIHRDIKPENLRLTEDHHLKIIDFGLAKWIRREPGSQGRILTESETQTIVGTMPYMSPEQLNNEILDARTDIWSAGCVLYEMATGRKPFNGKLTALVEAILHKNPVSPLSLNPEISQDMERIILKCLEKDPELRYQSAKEIAVDLHRLSPGASVQLVKPPEPPPQSRRWKPNIGFQTMAAVAVTLVAGVALSWAITYVLTPRSIAVLPFEDMSSDHSQQYLGEGLAEDTLNYLTKIPKLKVAARTSSFPLAGHDVHEIGRKLGVTTILEGSVRKDGNRIRITAQLIKVADGFYLWSESYDRELGDAFPVQDEIARAVASALKIALLGGSLPSPPPRPANPEAYDAFMRARHLMHKNDPVSADEALRYVTQAIELDRDYAPAYALRADILLNEFGGMARMDPAKAAEQARADTLLAIQKDPNLAAGYLMLSNINSYVDLNCSEAAKSLNKARELAPSDPDYFRQAARLEMCQGRLEEADALFKQELDRDPRADDHQYRAQVLLDLGRHEQARAELTEALNLNTQEAMVHEVLGEIYLNENRPQDALAEMEKEAAGCLRDMGIVIAYHALGQDQESKSALQQMIPICQDDWAYQIAQAYAYRGEPDEAFAWLDRAYRQHDPGLVWLKTDLKMTSLRADPRYKAMLERLHLPK